MKAKGKTRHGAFTISSSWRLARLGSALLPLLLSVSLGCVNLNTPWALSQRDGSAGEPSVGGSQGGGVAGTGGNTSAGGASGSDGKGGNSTSSSSSAPSGGDGGIDAPVGTDGSAGRDGGSAGDVRDAASGDADGDASCALCPVASSLVHRYEFNGTGAKISDSVGTAHGTAMNVQLSGSGTLALTDATQYVDLPDHILSTLTSATLEIWVTWAGGDSNQRILDFGSNEKTEDGTRATTTVIISPNSAPDGITPRLRVSYSNKISTSGTFVDGAKALPQGTMVQIVCVLDGEAHSIAMYLNGELQGWTSGLEALSLINDTNNWLGKSQYANDPGFVGTYHDFRMYSAPLTATQIKGLFAAGPNASFAP